jgi:hypothetical protein
MVVTSRSLIIKRASIALKTNISCVPVLWNDTMHSFFQMLYSTTRHVFKTLLLKIVAFCLSFIPSYLQFWDRFHCLFVSFFFVFIFVGSWWSIFEFFELAQLSPIFFACFIKFYLLINNNFPIVFGISRSLVFKIAFNEIK